MSLTQILVRLAAYLPYVLFATGLGIVLIGAVVFSKLRKGRKAAQPAAAAEGELEVEMLDAPPLPRPRQIRNTVRRGFATLRERVTSRSLRYRTPCFLLVGPEGSGKSTLLHELLPEAVSPRDPTEAIGCRWHFFDRGVTIEVDGRLLAYDANPAASDQGWAALNKALRHHRPERPIDGIVLAVPAGDLSGPRRLDSDALIGRARGVFRRLQEAQRVLGVRVPLYLVVTKCDLLRGFQDLCTTLPEERRDESFGWSNPYALESAFVPEWIDEAFESLSTDLFEVQMELLARGSAEQPEGLFEFSGAFRALQDPLRTFAAELCRQSAYQESFFFRGIYFTGDGTPDPGEHLLDSADLESFHADATSAAALPALPATLTASRQPYFLRDLFGQKVFGETGLARSASSTRLSRNRTILAIQAAIVAIVLIGGLGIWRASVVLERESGLLLSVLEDIHSDLTFLEVSAARPGTQPGAGMLDNRVFPLLSSMARVNVDRLSSVFIPSSWVSTLHWDISESMRQGFTNAVLPAMYGAMLAKGDSIVAPTTRGSLTASMLDGGELPRYLGAVARYGRNLERYDTVSFIGAEGTELHNMSQLVLYLFDEQLPPEFLGNERYHRIALWESYGERITQRDRPDFNARVVERAELLLRDYYDALINRLEEINTRFRSAESVQRLTAADLADFRRLRDDLVEVERVLQGSEAFWFDENQPLGPSLTAILDSIPVTPLTNPEAIDSNFTEMFERVRREKVQELNFRLSPFRDDATYAGAVSTGEGTMALSPQLSALQMSLDTLFNQPFIAAGVVNTPPPTLPPGSRNRWDIAALDRALAEHTQYQEFLATRQGQDTPGMTRLMEGLATVQLEARIAATVRQAMLAEPQSFAFGLRDRERELRGRVAAFQEPAVRLVQVLAIADGLGMVDLYQEFAGVYVDQAVSMLVEVDELLEESGLYRPTGGSLAGWSGGDPPIYAAFRAQDGEALERYLEQQRTRIVFLVTNFAAPLLGGLTSEPLAPFLDGAGAGANGLVQKWAGLVSELDRYEAGTGGSSVDAIERFIREEMTVTDVLTCIANSGRDGGSGSDFFLAARDRLRSQLYGRCQQLAADRASVGYADVRAYFNANLAGRYPFSRDMTPGAPEADLATLRDFFAVYDRLGEYRVAVTGGGATDFLGRMAQVRAFLAPLDPEAGAAAPAFEVDVDFRANRGEEVGGDQIVDWEMALGEGPLTYRGAGETAVSEWRPGSPANLTLRWALQSAQRPRAGGEAVVDDGMATFRYAGRWSLLKLMEGHLLSGAGGADGYLLRFDVPTTQAVGANSTARGEDARLFIRLRLRHPGGGAAPELPLFRSRHPPDRDRIS